MSAADTVYAVSSLLESTSHLDMDEEKDVEDDSELWKEHFYHAYNALPGYVYLTVEGQLMNDLIF